MFCRILVPLDGSAFAEAALGTAIALARRSGAKLRLLAVRDAGWSLVDGAGDGSISTSDRYLNQQRKRIEPLWPEVTTAVREGHVVDEILADVEAFDADLMVMATHGRGPLSRFWLGSVADQCVRRTHRPVLLIRPQEKDTARLLEPISVRRVVVPLNGSEVAERALGPATAIADLFSAPMALIRVVQDPTMIAGEFFPESAATVHAMFEEDYAESTSYLNHVKELLRVWLIAPDTRVTIAGQTPRAIVDYAGSDLIVMATHARAGLDRAILGSVCDAVVRAAIGPVLLVPPPAGRSPREAARNEQQAAAV